MNITITQPRQPSVTIVGGGLSVEVIAPRPVVSEVNIGRTGPQGPAGPSAQQQNYPAAVDLSGHRFVQRTALGLVTASSMLAADLGRVVGMTTGAVVAGALATVQSLGEFDEPGWAWDTALPVYLGADGIPTQTLPVGAAFAQIVGYPATPTTLILAIRDPIQL